ncbi:MAG: aspartyl protease family protein [Thermosynechococcaceae cyanobacterium]
MRLLTLPLLLLLLTACSSNPASSSRSVPAYRVPFEVAGEHIYLNVSLNGTSPRWYALDSGSQYTIVSQSQAAELALTPQQNIQIKGIGTKLIPATVASGVTLTLAGANWSTSEVVAMPPSFFSSLQQYLGREFSGIIGSDFFDRFVVEVDYTTQTIHLYDPKTYRYQGTGQQIPLMFNRQKPYVTGTVQVAPQQQFKGQFLIDLGSGSALDLNEPLTTQVFEELSRQPALPRVTLGVGGEKKVQIGRMQRLEIGDLSINAPITEFSLDQPPKQQKISGRIGGEILSQFRVILNYKRKRLILEPQSPGKTDYDMSGLWLKTEGPPFKQVLVDQVFAKSPGAVAGMKVGDRILSIDAQQNLSVSQVREHLRSPGVRQLQIQRDGQKQQIQLQLKPLI